MYGNRIEGAASAVCHEVTEELCTGEALVGGCNWFRFQLNSSNSVFVNFLQRN